MIYRKSKTLGRKNPPGRIISIPFVLLILSSVGGCREHVPTTQLTPVTPGQNEDLLPDPTNVKELLYRLDECLKKNDYIQAKKVIDGVSVDNLLESMSKNNEFCIFGYYVEGLVIPGVVGSAKLHGLLDKRVQIIILPHTSDTALDI